MYYEEDRVPYDAPDTVVREQTKDQQEKKSSDTPTK